MSSGFRRCRNLPNVQYFVLNVFVLYVWTKTFTETTIFDIRLDRLQSSFQNDSLLTLISLFFKTNWFFVKFCYILSTSDEFECNVMFDGWKLLKTTKLRDNERF